MFSTITGLTLCPCFTFQVLTPKLKEAGTNPNIIINIMAAIGELAQVAGIGMRPWIDDLCPILMDMLQDSSSLAKREVS